MNDRALRSTVCSLGAVGNGYPGQDGFDIVVASEIMAIFCLATSITDLKERLGKIVVAYILVNVNLFSRKISTHTAL